MLNNELYVIMIIIKVIWFLADLEPKTKKFGIQDS